MEIGFSFLIALFIMMIYKFYTEKKSNEDELSLEDKQHLAKARISITSTWDINLLKDVYVKCNAKSPNCKTFLLPIYKEQLNLLYCIRSEEIWAINKARSAIQNELSNCESLDQVNHIQLQFSKIFQQVPSLNRLLEKAIAEKRYQKSTQDLFHKCQTIDEIKKRFRGLALCNHPDKGGSERAMREILRQYEQALKNRSTTMS